MRTGAMEASRAGSSKVNMVTYVYTYAASMAHRYNKSSLVQQDCPGTSRYLSKATLHENNGALSASQGFYVHSNFSASDTASFQRVGGTDQLLRIEKG